MSLLYQENIIKTIEQLSSPYDLNDNLKYLTKSILRYFKLSKEINYTYIIGLLKNQDNQIVFYNLDLNTTFHIKLCPSAIIYNISNNICYILALTTSPKYRNNGYATKLLNLFIADIQKLHKNIKIILSATDDSFSFYEKNNFYLLPDDLIQHPILAKHEKYDEQKLYYIFERDL